MGWFTCNRRLVVTSSLLVAVPVAGDAGGQCRRIGSDYTASPNGTYLEIPNWYDAQTAGPHLMADGGVTVDASGLSHPQQGGDWFLFALRSPGENPVGTTPAARNQPILMADPSVLRLDVNGTSHYYITGTTGAPLVRTRFNQSTPDEVATLGTQQANLIIYVTTDFQFFAPYMTVFDDSQRDDRVITVGTKTYADIKSPHLYQDPADPSHIYLCFSAIEGPTNPPALAELFNDSSIYLVWISITDFLSWANLDWYAGQGTRFAGPGGGPPAWYGYQPVGSGSYYYDGGVQASGGNSQGGVFIPAAGDPHVLATIANRPIAGNLEARGRGWGHYNPTTNPASGWASHTYMADGPYVFVDPKVTNGDRPDRWLIYDWTDAYGTRSSDPCVPAPAEWGNSVCAHPLLAVQYLFDSTRSAIFLANNQCTSNRITPSSTSCAAPVSINNGRADLHMNLWWWGGVAESSAAAYLPAADRYYHFVSRNTWDSSAYQIVYRISGRESEGGRFEHLNLGSSAVFDVPETILLRSDRYNVPAPPGAAGGSTSFGSPSIFEIRDGAGATHPYMAFHAKFESSARRTIFFKELDVINAATGELRRLRENSEGDMAASSRRNGVASFRLPRCLADWDGDGVITPSDIAAHVNSMLSDWTNGTACTDHDGNGSAEPADQSYFVNVWYAAVQSGSC
jgi:hypothetical protein